MAYVHNMTLKIPAPVSCLSFGSPSTLAAGSDDGTVRFYDLPAGKVTKAIRGFQNDISSIRWVKSTSVNEEPSIWVASGPTAHLVKLAQDKMILAASDASTRLVLGEDEEDVLNELSLDDSKKHLAFSTDAGTAGIVELAGLQVARMKASHTTVCSSVKFIPDRPSELVSGGYDSSLLHLDFKSGILLSRYDISAALPSSGVSLSPPFVLSVSVSQTGLVAATTADGRIWLGSGGDKSSPGAKKKRSRKWEGLREADGTFSQIADGPVIASTFTAPSVLLTCTLLGKFALHSVSYDSDQRICLNTTWTGHVVQLEKVNAIAANDDWLTIGGFSKDGAGLVEVWKVSGEIPQLVEAVAELSVQL